MKHVDLRIDGMTCHHCVMAVQKELQKVPGIQIQNVKIGEASLDIDETKVGPEALKAAVEDAGYRIVS